jgi:hypothetical protein
MLGDLAAYLFVAANSFYPMSNHFYMEKKEVTETRYEDFTSKIASAVSRPEYEPLFAGDDGREKSGLLLISIASFESGFVAKVLDCEKLGDGGHAFGPFQTHIEPYSVQQRDKICSNVDDAVDYASKIIRASFKMCHNYPQLGHLAAYTDGNEFNTKRAFRRSSERMGRALNFWEKSPYFSEIQ